ncbi:zinc finger, LSD1-type, caspase-like domain protein [Tanacetum coccineum]
MTVRDPSFASFGLTPSNQAPPYSEVFGLTPSQSLSQAPPSAAASFGLTPSGSFNYVKPQSGFIQAPPSQNTSAASFGLKPSGSFNYVKPQSGFGGLTPSGSFNYTQQQQQPVFPSLTPSPSFSYGVPGRKKAVIIGVSYKNTRHELKGCINDAKYMKHLLITKFHFREDQIVMFTEEEIDPNRIPTGRNMRSAMTWLIEGCQPGDSLVFHFSGHGSRQRNYNGDEIDGYDETLCPLDFETEGMIVDDEINAKLVKPIPYGVKLHAIIDSCHSGTVLDLPNLCRMKR